MHVPDQFVRADIRDSFARGHAPGFRTSLRRVADPDLRSKLAQVYDAHQANRIGSLARQPMAHRLSMSTMAPRVRMTKKAVGRHNHIARTLAAREG